MSQRTAVLTAAILGSAIVFLDATIVNVALETIGRELPATFVGRLEGLTYVNSAYFAVLAALLILAGAISDYYGRRRTFRIGLIGFGAASVACGLAPTMEVLIVARILQGAFGAILVPGSLAIITAFFDGEERGRAIGLWAAGTSATSIIGPLLGGILGAEPDVAPGIPHQRPARAPRAVGHDARAGEPRRERHAGTSTGSAPRSSRSPSAASRSARPVARRRTGRIRWRGWRSSSVWPPPWPSRS